MFLTCFFLTSHFLYSPQSGQFAPLWSDVCRHHGGGWQRELHDCRGGLHGWCKNHCQCTNPIQVCHNCSSMAHNRLKLVSFFFFFDYSPFFLFISQTVPGAQYHHRAHSSSQHALYAIQSQRPLLPGSVQTRKGEGSITSIIFSFSISHYSQTVFSKENWGKSTKHCSALLKPILFVNLRILKPLN